MRRPPLARTLLCSIIATGVLAACAPAAPTSPPPSPSVYHCIADGVRTPGTCSRADYEAQQKEQQLFTEAQRVYRTFTDERTRIRGLGGVDEPTPIMLQTSTDTYLRQWLAVFRLQKERGDRITGGVKIGGFAIERSQTKPGADFSMRACEDGRDSVGIDTNGDRYPGRLAKVILFFKNEESQFKIFDWSGSEAQSCP